GAPTNSRAVAAFARPRTDAPAFRQNDAVARALLRTLSATEAGTATRAEGSRTLAACAPSDLPTFPIDLLGKP
ncbi:hypothetical protein ABZ322_44190, partial [Streptomyces sp. NPDC006129]